MISKRAVLRENTASVNLSNCMSSVKDCLSRQFSGTPIRQRTIQRIPSLSPRAGAWNADKETRKGKGSVAQLQGGRGGVSKARGKTAVESEAIRGRTNSSAHRSQVLPFFQ